MQLLRKSRLLSPILLCLIACSADDIRETVHYNGIRKERIEYQNGKPDGKYQRWTSHGDLAESGQFKNGLREGEWTQWFANGKVEARGIYKSGKKTGEWKGFTFDGKTAWEHEFQNGEPVGVWQDFHAASGNVKEKNSCFANVAEGTRETFAENGKRERIEHCKYGTVNGIVETFYPGGALETRTEFFAGLPNGKSEQFRASGELWKRAFFKNGVRDSVWSYFRKDGSVERESIFSNGNGTAYGYIGDGGIDAETTFVENQVHDTIWYKLPERKLLFAEVWDRGQKQKLLSFYSKNHIASEGNFENGLRNGSWRNWYESGKIKDSLFYKDGEPFGDQMYFDSTGKLYMRKNQLGKNGPMEVHFQ